jgi:hypothetical protein
MDFSGADDSPTMMELPQNQLLLEDEQKMYDIKEPHHNDVLCGRGVTTNRHPGNESFRSLVGLNKVQSKHGSGLHNHFFGRSI